MTAKTFGIGATWGQTLKIEYKLWSVSFLSSAGWVEARNPTDFYREERLMLGFTHALPNLTQL